MRFIDPNENVYISSSCKGKIRKKLFRLRKEKEEGEIGWILPSKLVSHEEYLDL